MKAETNEKPRKLPQRVDRDYLLREAEHFRDHKKGIPEWIKNSDDSYTRHEEYDGTKFDQLPIVVDFGRTAITCLDFGGASSKDMIEHIPFYGSTKAATLGKKMIHSVSGGHGNGGKYYGLAQFGDCKIASYYNGKLTILRINSEGDYVDIEDLPCSGEDALIKIGVGLINTTSLWWSYFSYNRPDLLDGMKKGKLNFFCWIGIKPKDKRDIESVKGISRLVSEITVNPQARSALKSRVVDILFQGKLYFQNLKPEQVETDPNFGVKEFVLPNKLGDYQFNKGHTSVLKVWLAKRALIGDKSSLNTLEVDAYGRSIATYDLPSFMLEKGISKNLIASIDCPELKEYKCVSNDRVHLVENETAKLFTDWCRNKISEVIEEVTNKEKQLQEKKNLEELSGYIKEIQDEIKDLLEQEDLLRYKYNPKGTIITTVMAPTDKPGYGTDHKVKKRGGGKRRGGLEEREDKSSQKPSKARLLIKLSNWDDDPLNPGKKFDMIEREPVLHQRPQDIPYGIWWINTQKSYIRKMRIGDPAALAFYPFLTKEIVFSYRARNRYKEQIGFDPDGIEELNFDLIDQIFNRVVPKMGYDLATDKSSAERLLECIKSKQKFTVAELAEELKIDPMYITTLLHQNESVIMENFKVTKTKNDKGASSNLYVRK